MTEAQGASTLIEVLDRLRNDGFAEQFIGQEDGTVRCMNCETRTPADQLAVDGFHRLEGASDPSDENIVVWAPCPSCGAGGALTIGYGTNSTDSDQAVLERIDLDDVENGGTEPG